jgi:hypothetical protein
MGIKYTQTIVNIKDPISLYPFHDLYPKNVYLLNGYKK